MEKAQERLRTIKVLVDILRDVDPEEWNQRGLDRLELVENLLAVIAKSAEEEGLVNSFAYAL